MRCFTNTNTIAAFALVLFLGLTVKAQSQRAHPLVFQSGILPEQEVQRLAATMQAPGAWSSYTIGDQVYGILQFDAPQSATKQIEWAKQGIHLLEYLPQNAYLARMPQRIDPGALEVRAAIPLLPSFKLARPLLEELGANLEGQLALRLLPLPDVAPEELAQALAAAGVKIDSADTFSIFLTLRASEVNDLAAHPAIYFLELAPPQPEPEGERANARMWANWANQAISGNYDGTGVWIGIADDGTVNHIDVAGRVTSMTTVNWGAHGDMTVGIAIGAGNINPRARGLAPGAHLQLSLISGYPHIQNAVAYLDSFGTIVTNTSYGEGCGGYYSSSTYFIDHQVYSNGLLMHVFSAGNSSSSGCSSIYGHLIGPDGRRYGNITGGQKAGKNVIAVGNLTFGDVLSLSSSRGPTADGRIKPDICANGQGSLTTDANNRYRLGSGTSAAAPAVAGIYAVLVQAYRGLHNGQNPPSALLKGALLNTADDLGRPGPDYEYGWGRVNGRRALRLIEQQHYQSGSSSQGLMNSHPIFVPAGTKELRVMLYWNDPAASPVAAQALVNDLDLSLQGPNNAIYLPYRLSTVADIDSLTKPAYAGIDRVNNMEQVVLKNPAAGVYNARAFGHLVPQGPQDYYLVYSFVQDELEIAYPRGGERLTPGQNIDIFWDAVGNQGSFSLQYSANGGQSWNTIASNVAGHLRHYSWTVPNLSAPQARVRISRGGSSTAGDDFVVLGAPDFHLTSAGSNTMRVFWAPVAGASSYQVYAMGSKFMEPIASTTATGIDLPAPPPGGNWYSVSALTADGKEGPRALAKHYEHFPCESELALHLQFDENPGQVSWKIFNQAGAQLASGGPYSDALANQLLVIPLCLPQGCHIFSIFDSGNNGLCCSAGQGYYRLYNGQGQLLTSGSSFGASSSANFCLQGGPPPLQASISASPSTSCHNSANGWAIVFPSGGSGSYSFAWSNGATTQQITGLTAGNYQVTVSDGNASLTVATLIQQPDSMVVGIAVQDASCGDTASGTASAVVSNGAAPFAYQWSNGATAPTIANLPPGQYQLTVTDIWGCTQTAAAQVQAGSTPSVSLTAFPPSCAAAPNGAIFSAVTGGTGSYTYLWSNGSTTASLTGIAGGFYSLTVTDGNGCAQSASTTLAGPPALLAQATIGMDGQSASITVEGGVPPYQYLWPDGTTASQAADLEPGTYSVTVTDNNNCVAIADFTIEPPGPGLCLSQGGNASFNWIQQVQLGAILNPSGNNGGYADFTEQDSLQLTVEAGQAFNLGLWPGFQSNPFMVNWRAWIDLDEDGQFDGVGEQLLPSTASSGALSFTLVVPASTTPGPKRLRIAMAFGIAPQPCEDFVYGEVEDYTIIVGAPTNIEYCESAGMNTSFEWIQHVSIGSMSNTSGNDGGYGDYSYLMVPAEPGASLPFSLQPGYNGGVFPESWSIWIDYNQDGQFDAPEELVFSQLPIAGAVTGQLSLPAEVGPGQYRLRIVMRWSTAFSACGIYGWGETEDYTLQIMAPGNQLAQRAGLPPLATTPAARSARLDEAMSGQGEAVGPPVLFPNPSRETFTVRYHLAAPGEVVFQLLDAQGRPWESRRVEAAAGWSIEQFEDLRLPPGSYFLKITGREEGWVLPLQVVR
jgi:hypothetical protein